MRLRFESVIFTLFSFEIFITGPEVCGAREYASLIRPVNELTRHPACL